MVKSNVISESFYLFKLVNQNRQVKTIWKALY